jgi:hypothetical protein
MERPRLVACVGAALLYLVAFRVLYCVREGCTHPADWWFHLRAESQAAWAGSLGTAAAVWWGVFLYRAESRSKREIQRRLALPAARRLIGQVQHALKPLIAVPQDQRQAVKYVRIKRHESIKPADTSELRVVTDKPAFAQTFQADEVGALLDLVEELDHLNREVAEMATDPEPDKGASGVVWRVERIRQKAHELLGMLRGRYLPLRTLGEAADK